MGATGGVNILEAQVSISVAGRTREFKEVEAIVDTGFSSWLTLPEDIIQELDLTPYGSRRVQLADGRIVETDIFSALAQWLGRFRPILIYKTGSERPLLGTALLENYRLTIDMRQGGRVSIGPIP